MSTDRVTLTKLDSNKWHCFMAIYLDYEKYDWCLSNFNGTGDRWKLDTDTWTRIYFRDEEDAMLFMLRWG